MNVWNCHRTLGQFSLMLRPIQIFASDLWYYFNHLICFNLSDHKAYGFSAPKDHQVVTAIEYQGRVTYAFPRLCCSMTHEYDVCDVIYLLGPSALPHTVFLPKCCSVLFLLENPFSTSSVEILDIRWKPWCTKKASNCINYLQQSGSNLWNW